MDVADLLREELKRALRRMAEAARAAEPGGNANVAVAVNVDARGRVTAAVSEDAGARPAGTPTRRSTTRRAPRTPS